MKKEQEHIQCEGCPHERTRRYDRDWIYGFCKATGQDLMIERHKHDSPNWCPRKLNQKTEKEIGKMKKEKILRTVAWILAILLVIFIGYQLVTMINGNRGIGWDLNNKFDQAIIMMDGDVYYDISIKSWRDFENSDTIQIMDMNGTVYLTHYSNVILLGGNTNVN